MIGHDLTRLDPQWLRRLLGRDAANHRADDAADPPAHVEKSRHLHPVPLAKRLGLGSRALREIDPHAANPLLEIEALGRGERDDARGAQAMAAEWPHPKPGDLLERHERSLERRAGGAIDHREVFRPGDAKPRCDELAADVAKRRDDAGRLHLGIDEVSGIIGKHLLGQFDHDPAGGGLDKELPGTAFPFRIQALHDAADFHASVVVGPTVEPAHVGSHGRRQFALRHHAEVAGDDRGGVAARLDHSLHLHDRAQRNPQPGVGRRRVAAVRL